jgi:tetratricopeptide (TPR) repeat protein
MRENYYEVNVSNGLQSIIGASKDKMNHTHRSRLIAALVAALAVTFSTPVLAADAVPGGKPRAPAAREAKRAAPVAKDLRPGDAQYHELSGQVVYQVLLAEVALQRGNTELASQAYADLALRTRDPKVLERALEIAGYAKRMDMVLEIARLWLDVEPQSVRAQQLLVGAMVMSNQLDDLAPHLIRMLEMDKDALGANLVGLNRMLARNPDRGAVFRLVDKVCAPFFGIAEAHYAVAVAAGSASDLARARAEVKRAQELRPDWEMPALLEAQLLARDSTAEAVASLERFVARNPNARDAELHLARALVSEKRYADAKRHFDHLLREYPNNPEIVYPVAILALQQEDLVLAEVQLKHLLTLDFPDKSVAYFYLGQIADDSQRGAEAADYYARVGAGEHYLPAQIRSAHLLAEQGKLDVARQQLRDVRVKTELERVQLMIAEAQLLREAKRTQEAFNLLDTALSKQPEQTDLLYESALLAEKLGRMETLETYLRKLIVLKPDSAQAYNALGYSYADRNLRLPEARELIEKALKLAPDDPFILDSMGWILYRQGDLQGALVYLERAFAKRPDPEIAAHMGEVLWVLGRKDDARRAWREAQKKYPGNEELAAVVKKFAP